MEKDEALQNVWNVHSEILSKRGVDLPKLLKQWAVQQEERLPSPGARSDFRELCTSGCVPEILAVLIALMRWSPKLEDFWGKLYGNLDKRRRVIKNVEKAAKAIEDLFEFPISMEVEDEEFVKGFAEMDRISPGRLVSELRLYARTLELIDRIPRETETRSLADFLKFSLTEYVKHATGRFRDRGVSGLIAEAIGPADYNEVAHRMWRSRNFKRMSSHFKMLSELLSDIHDIASPRNVTNSQENK